MKTVIIEYARISPAVLADRISNAFHCLTNWKDIDEDYFEFSVYGCTELAELEDVLAEYVQYLAFSILMPQARARSLRALFIIPQGHAFCQAKNSKNLHKSFFLNLCIFLCNCC